MTEHGKDSALRAAGEFLAELHEILEEAPPEIAKRFALVRAMIETALTIPVPVMGQRCAIEPKYEIDDAGTIYNRQSGNPIPRDEPLMLFRGQDVQLLPLLARYILMCTDTEHRRAVALRLAAIAQWQTDNPLRVKEPSTVIDENWRG